MNKKASSLIAILLVSWLITNNVLSVFACAPAYDKAVFVSWLHSDFPLTSFAAGNLGVMQKGWARSYLCVAYRYLTGQGLTKTEQTSIERLWMERLAEESASDSYGSDGMHKYIELRGKVLKINPQKLWDIHFKVYEFCKANAIGANSFVEALETLKARIKHYGESSSAVREWIKGQDCVFGLNAAGALRMPGLLGAGFDKTLKEDRAYQRAAVAFYLRNFDEARAMFKQMARDKNSARHRLVSYMVARCRANASLGAGAKEDQAQVIASLEKSAGLETDAEQKQNLIDLICFLKSTQRSVGENLARLVRSVSSRTSDPLAAESFGRNVGDLTYTITRHTTEPDDENTGRTALKVMDYDLTAWLTTIYDGYDSFVQTEEELIDEERRWPDSSGWIKDALTRIAQHQSLLKERGSYALSQWRKNHRVHWLVAVMLCGGLRSAERADALRAAEQISPQSPAYQTAAFYVIDALLAKGELREARARLATVMAGKSRLALSTANLFQSQQLPLSTSVDDYLRAACMRLIPSSDDALLLPSDWRRYETQNRTEPVLGGWDNEVARDLDYNLPFSLWLKLARWRDLPPNLHARIVCAAWVRSILLGKSKDTDLLTSELVRAYPAFAARVARYRNSPPGREKQFALASLILENYGMAPYVRAGLPRFAAIIDQFNYYQENYWLPLKPPNGTPKEDWRSVVSRGNSPDGLLMASYYKQGIDRLLTSAQKKEAEDERQQIERCHPSALLGQAVLNEAKANPSAPELPQLLYKVVKLPRWSGESKTGSIYSRAALRMLKEHYPGDRWAKKVSCYY